MQEQIETDVTVEQWDSLLDERTGPAAIVIQEHLRPAAGLRSPISPPTFAGSGQGKSDYHIDPPNDPTDWQDVEAAARDGRVANRCTMDSVPSQANRLESGLRRFEGSAIPEVTLEGTGQNSMSLLEIGHRIADAAVWSADGYDDFQRALESFAEGDAAPLARLAPTSLVFGYWDSRGTTGGKARRLVRSEIVAENVVKLTRRSQYRASIDPEHDEELKKALEEARSKAKGDREKDVGSQLGFRDAPASGLGGVIAHGDITRTTILSLTGLRNLADRRDGEEDPEATQKLRRYLFALMLGAASRPQGGWDLREGCLLVQQDDGTDGQEVSAVKCILVYGDGHEEPWDFPPDDQVGVYVKTAATEFFGDAFPNPRTLTFKADEAATRVRAKLAEKTSKKTP